MLKHRDLDDTMVRKLDEIRSKVGAMEFPYLRPPAEDPRNPVLASSAEGTATLPLGMGSTVPVFLFNTPTPTSKKRAPQSQDSSVKKLKYSEGVDEWIKEITHRSSASTWMLDPDLLRILWIVNSRSVASKTMRKQLRQSTLHLRARGLTTDADQKRYILEANPSEWATLPKDIKKGLERLQHALKQPPTVALAALKGLEEGTGPNQDAQTEAGTPVRNAGAATPSTPAQPGSVAASVTPVIMVGTPGSQQPAAWPYVPSQ